MELYPLKFEHIYKDKIWGGTRFKTLLKRVDVPSDTCGESWEISAVEDNISIVANGFLQGNSLQEIIEIYMDEIVGGKVYEQFGPEFPLLLNF
jgi:mannose-6-phosphate isomerase